MNSRKLLRVFIIVLASFTLAQCSYCDKPVYFQMAVVSQKSDVTLDIDSGELIEKRTIEGDTFDPDKLIKLVDNYCSSDSLVRVKYTLNGQDTVFTVNRNKVRGCFLGDKINKKPAVYFDLRVDADSIR